MEETVKIFSSKVTCPCGCNNAHIWKGVVTTGHAEIYFQFECGHKRRDVFHFHEGTTYCETQYFFKDRDHDFRVGTNDFWDPEERQKAYEKDQVRILAKVAEAEAKAKECGANDGSSI